MAPQEGFEILKDVNFTQWLLGILLLYVGWSVRRAINGFEESIKNLFNKYDNHEGRITRVETVHDLKGCDQPVEHGTGRAQSYRDKSR